MMRLTFQLTQSDLVQFNEYHSAHSPLQIKARRKHRSRVPIIYLIFTAIFVVLDNLTLAAFFGVFAVLWFFISPRLMTKRYKKYFQKHIEETVGDELNEPSTVQLMDDGIHSTSHMGHSIFKYSVVEKIIENDGFTYIYIGKGMALIIPHDRVSGNEVEEFVAEIGKRKINCEPVK